MSNRAEMSATGDLRGLGSEAGTAPGGHWTGQPAEALWLVGRGEDLMEHGPGRDADCDQRPAPLRAGFFLGLGLGGFFDGIVLHQILQWHHMASSTGYPVSTVDGLRMNILFDGLFHAATWLFVMAGVVLLWRDAFATSRRALAGAMLIGFGTFNVVEGLVNHHLLGLHHVKETVARDQWIYWDAAFLVWGGVMVGGGLLLRQADRRDG